MVNHNCFDSVSAFYRKVREEDELVFKIDYYQYTNHWDSITIGIDDEIETLSDFTKMAFSYGIYCSSNLFTSINVQYLYHRFRSNNVQFPIWMKMV